MCYPLQLGICEKQILSRRNRQAVDVFCQIKEVGSRFEWIIDLMGDGSDETPQRGELFVSDECRLRALAIGDVDGIFAMVPSPRSRPANIIQRREPSFRKYSFSYGPTQTVFTN